MNERLEQTTDHRLLESVGRSALAAVFVLSGIEDVDDPEKRALQRTQLLKNLGLVGGSLLYLSKPRGAEHS